MKIILGLFLSFCTAAFSQQASDPAQGFHLAGRVVATSGEPMRKVIVRLTSTATSESQQARTNGDGSFELNAVPAGAYRVNIDRSGNVLQIEKISGVSSKSLQVNADKNDIQITITKEAVITGRVTDSDGDPVRNANVFASIGIKEKGKTRYVPVAQGTTNDRGEYRIFDLSEGDYYVRVVPGAGNMFSGSMGAVAATGGGEIEPEFAATFYPSALFPAEGSPVSVCPGEEGNADITMRAPTGFVVRGAIPAPAKNTATMVMMMGTDSLMMPLRAQVDERGNFTIKNVTPGEYVLMANTFSTKEAGDDTNDNRNVSKVITVENGSVEGINLSPATGSTISGSFRVADGSRPDFTGLMVTLTDASGLPFQSAYADVKADGTFTLENVQPGDYRVLVNANGPALKIFGPHYIATADFDGTDALKDGLRVTGGPQPHSLRITSNGHGAQVTGIVQDAAGRPVSGATVALVPEGDLEGRDDLRGSATTSSDGSYKLEGVAPGKFSLAAYLPKGESIRDFAAIAASMESTEATHIQVTGSPLKQDLKLADSSGFRSKLRSCSGDK